jgi:kinetochore protein Mis12/MTW1
MIPSDLPSVLPHQEGLDFTITVEKEQELVDEVEQLRKRPDEVLSQPLFSHFTRLTASLQQRRINRYLLRSVNTETRRLKRAETRLSKLDALSGPDGCILDDTLPTKYLAMCQTLSLPPLEPSFGSVNLTEPGKHQWEPSKSGYLNWAVGRLLVNGEAIDKVENSALEIGCGEDLRHALHALDVANGKLITLVGQ